MGHDSDVGPNLGEIESLSLLPSGKRLQNYGTSPCYLFGQLTISMAMFNSYVSLPEGILYISTFEHIWTMNRTIWP